MLAERGPEVVVPLDRLRGQPGIVGASLRRLEGSSSGGVGGARPIVQLLEGAIQLSVAGISERDLYRLAQRLDTVIGQRLQRSLA